MQSEYTHKKRMIDNPFHVSVVRNRVRPRDTVTLVLWSTAYEAPP